MRVVVFLGLYCIATALGWESPMPSAPVGIFLYAGALDFYYAFYKEKK